jgi:hypothetical protein
MGIKLDFQKDFASDSPAVAQIRRRALARLVRALGEAPRLRRYSAAGLTRMNHEGGVVGLLAFLNEKKNGSQNGSYVTSQPARFTKRMRRILENFWKTSDPI